VTVLEAIQKSAEFLAKRDIESPRLQAELLLAHHLKMPRMKLYLNFERALSAEETDSYREMIKRRGLREPLQHIAGTTSFCGFEIMVNRHALVPRPETEILAERGWTFLTALGSATAWDMGTGTGCIAIALAAKSPNAKIIATDISPDALALAKANAEKNNVHVEFSQGDGFAAAPKETRFDLIISNPPYIPAAEIETLQPEVRDFDPRAALDGGADGLDFYRMFAARAKPFLKPAGKIMLEFGDGQAPAIRALFENEKWIVEEIKSDYSQRLRILMAKI
jgi:release factor glutamine methyltransferase